MPVLVDQKNRTFYLNGEKTSYVLHIDEDSRLLNLHWGKRLPVGSLHYSPSDYRPVASFDLPLSVRPLEIPVCGSGWYGTPAISVTNACGDDVTDLRVQSWEVFPGKKPLPGLPATYAENNAEAESIAFTLTDSLTGVKVTALYSVFTVSGAVTRSLAVENCGNQAVRLKSLLSASVPLWQGGLDVVHLKGAWARERSVVRLPAGEGEYRISSARGASGHENNPFIALCSPGTDEFSGEVWALSLVYSGSFLAFSRADHFGHTRLSAGMNPEVFSWLLEPGESVVSPEAVMVYSAAGLNGMSQTYHRLYRSRLVRGFWRDRERPVLVNNWEGTYFDFDESRLLAIAEKAAQLGIELFVLDDGWFGKRNQDNCSLGDWTVNLQKLPHGLSGLGERINALGLRFGLWFEPEMVSPDSDLYRAHPDWCLHVDGRERTEARQQLILDLSRKEVQDCLIASVSAVLSSAPVSYVKWDMNRNMTEAFSSALPPERKFETQHRYMLGLYRVLETLTSSFPETLFESCSGGGGRFDPGMLYYMPQTWTSDDTDAAERLKIQYGTSLVYPSSAMGAHISAVPNHQTGRVTSLSFRGSVALGGNFGFELDLAKMAPEEIREAAELVSRVKDLRSLTQFGTFWRLSSPFEGRFASWAFISEEKDRVLFCAYQTLGVPNASPVRIRIRGVDENAWYIAEDGQRLSGAALAYHGITVHLRGDFSSVVLLLKRE